MAAAREEEEEEEEKAMKTLMISTRTLMTWTTKMRSKSLLEAQQEEERGLPKLFHRLFYTSVILVSVLLLQIF
jgi:hypothetical protein